MSRSSLYWQDDRWHLDGRGIHAGTTMELRGPDDGVWFAVRIESSNRGKTLIAFHSVHGIQFTYRLDPDYDQLRWPGCAS